MQLFDGPVVGRAFHFPRHHVDCAILDGSEDDVLGVHQKQPLLRLHQQFYGRRFRRSHLADERFQPFGGRGFGLQRFLRALNGPRQTILLDRLQDVIDGVDFEGLHGIVVKRRRENDLRNFSLAVHQLLDHVETVEARHLHVEKHQVRRMFLDEGESLHAVFALPDQMHFGETFQQVDEFVASGLLVVHDERVDRHRMMSG